MDAFSDPAIERVVIMSSAQVGKTEILNNIVGFFVDQDPSPILVVMPTVESGEGWSKERLAPMIRDTRCLSAKMSSKSRDAGNTLTNKTFPGGHLAVAGSNSESSLSSRPIRVVLCDEVDRYPLSVEGKKGDPITMAVTRAETFANRKILLVSTPGIAGYSRIEMEFERSDKRYYHVPCHDCGHEQVLRWAQVQWPKDKPRDAVYVCEECGSAWGDALRWRAISQGHWVATDPDKTVAGFHLWAGYSTFRPLGEIAEQWVNSQSNQEELKAFVNTKLGETWVEKGEAPEWERIYERRERYKRGMVPEGGLLLTAGVDVQKDRLEVSVWAWGEHFESWLVDHIIIWGGPDDDDAWAQLTDLLDQTWQHEKGGHIGLTKLAIDTGYDSMAVYAWARSVRSLMVCPVKGIGAQARTSLVSGPTYVDVTVRGKKISRGAKLWTLSVSDFKQQTYRYLRANKPTDEDLAAGIPYPKGYVHLPEGVESEWCQQLVAEELVTVRTRSGYSKSEWRQKRERNEALDCRVYARAALWIHGADWFKPERWEELRNAAESSYRQSKREDDVPQVQAQPRKSPRRDNWLGTGGGSWF